MSTYTPGPLVARGQKIETELHCSVAWCYDGFVSGVSGKQSISKAQATANAALLVKAHALLFKLASLSEGLNNGSSAAERAVCQLAEEAASIVAPKEHA